MKIQQATTLFKSGKLEHAEIRRRPGNRQQWFIMVRQLNGKSMILADEQDEIVVDDAFENLLETLKGIGFREALVVF